MTQQVKDPALPLSWVAAVVQVWSLAREFPHAMGVAKKITEEMHRNQGRGTWGPCAHELSQKSKD